MPETPFFRATEALRYIHQQLPPELKHPAVGIICGSGLGELACAVELEPQMETSYGEVPYFPKSTGM